MTKNTPKHLMATAEPLLFTLLVTFGKFLVNLIRDESEQLSTLMEEK